MRLGEVRIAMGKLDEAIAALRSAADTTEPAAQAMIHFLLAVAYDRARRPADALVEAGEGMKLDRPLATLQNPTGPTARRRRARLHARPGVQRGAGTAGVLARVLPPVRRPRRPTARGASAPTSTSTTSRPPSCPDAISRSGTAPFDLDAARAAARRAMPAMRACLARLPSVVIEVEISRAGPRTPPTDRVRPRFFTPPDGVTVRRAVGEMSDKELDAVDRCLQPLATRLALPPVKERDTYYKAAFHVVGP